MEGGRISCDEESGLASLVRLLRGVLRGEAELTGSPSPTVYGTRLVARAGRGKVSRNAHFVSI
jgi:hypothetical protein